MRSVSGVTNWGWQAWHGLVNVLFPPRCGGCAAEATTWCAACQQDLAFIHPPLCDACGEPATIGLCSKCQAQPLHLDFIRSVVIFDGRVRDAIHRFKYERYAALAEVFGTWLAEYWRAAGFQADWLMPVPLHTARERDRGYNQAYLLARQLGRQIGVPALERGLQRTRATQIQMTLNAAERKANVANAFRCSDERVSGRRVVIIDDVCTTGATLDACASAALASGAHSVFGFTLARAP